MAFTNQSNDTRMLNRQHHANGATRLITPVPAPTSSRETPSLSHDSHEAEQDSDGSASNMPEGSDVPLTTANLARSELYLSSNDPFGNAIETFAASNIRRPENAYKSHLSSTTGVQHSTYNVKPPLRKAKVLPDSLREVSRGVRAPDGSYHTYVPLGTDTLQDVGLGEVSRTIGASVPSYRPYRDHQATQEVSEEPELGQSDEQTDVPSNIKTRKTKQTHRLGPKLGNPQKPKVSIDYTDAIPFPENHTKKESDRCLTCIRYNRVCIGTKLVRVDARGRISWRCFTCTKEGGKGARSGRNCLWADPAKGIFTYEDAQKDKNAIINWKNSAEGRAARFQARAGDAAAQRAYGLKQSSPTTTPTSRATPESAMGAKEHQKSAHFLPNRSRTGHWAWIPSAQESGNSSIVDDSSSHSLPTHASTDNPYSVDPEESDGSEDEPLEVQVWRAWMDLQQMAKTRLEGVDSTTSRTRLFVVMQHLLNFEYTNTRRDIRDGLEARVKAYGRDVVAAIGLETE